jgi:SulP family sulfate permease
MSRGENAKLAKWLPIIGWLKSYDRTNLRFDVIAGLTVAALVIPKNLGYAGIAQLPVEYGLYAAAAGALLYAVFGTSRQISTGPSSSLAAVAAGAIAVSGVAAGEQTAELVAAITITTALLFLLMGVFRMGWMSQFLSRAVVTGFLFGAAIDVVVGELGKLTGSPSDGDNTYSELKSWFGGFDERHSTTMVVSLVALATVLGLRRFAPKVPGALVLLVGGLVTSSLFDLAGRGVATVGDVPRGLPELTLPPGELIRANLTTIGISALAIVLIGYSQSAGDARVFAARHRYRVDINQESIAQGVSNMGAGLFQGMPVSTSLSASSLNDAAGARTQMASLVTGATVVMTLLLIAPLFSDLPKPILGVVIIDAVVFGMMDVAEMRRMYVVKRFDFWIAVAAILAVLSAGVLAGVVIGVAISILWLVYVSTFAETAELAQRPGSAAFDRVDLEGGQTYPGIVVLRFSAGLFFATSDVFMDALRQVALAEREEPLKAVIVDFGGVNFIDSQGAATLTQIVELAEVHGLHLRLARVQPAVAQVLRAEGVLAQLGDANLHSNLEEAVAAELARPSAGATDGPR